MIPSDLGMVARLMCDDIGRAHGLDVETTRRAVAEGLRARTEWERVEGEVNRILAMRPDEFEVIYGFTLRGRGS